MFIGSHRYLKMLLVWILLLHTNSVCCEIHRILIIGVAKSGTAYMSHLLKESGYEVAHENYGKDGCVSWLATVNMYNPSSPLSDADVFLHTFHQVRHPLSVITSIVYGLQDWKVFYPCENPNPHWSIICKNIPQTECLDSIISVAAKFYYYWNLLAEEKSEWRYRIEDFEQAVPEFEMRSGLKINSIMLHEFPKNCNSWTLERNKISWEILRSEISEDLYTKIQSMAIRYGYDVQ
jgi:hypothetical protein